MSENYSILDLSKLLKEANQYCGLGSYEKAINKYDIAIPVVEARILELYYDTKLQEKWKAILKYLKEEREDIREIIDSLETFHYVYDKNGQILRNPDIYPSTNVNQNIQKNPSPPKQVKRPSPPKPMKRPSPPKPVKRPQPPTKPPSNPQPPKGGKNAPADKPKPKEQKKSYLESLYPDGKGPDSELIEMLEREVVDTNPHVNFDDIAELDQAKQALQEAALLPLIIPNFFTGLRRPWKGVLLYGPPGTGKTMLAKALATKGDTTFFNVHSSSFASKWRGESEKLVRILFEMAKYYAPTVIFIDEVDSLGTKRGQGNEGDGSRRVKAELLVQMDGASSASSAGANAKAGDTSKTLVMVMGATNRPWDLDEALLRRFEKRIYIPLPNEVGRKQMFYLNTKKIEIDKNIDSKELVNLTKGYSGADISNVCRDAALMPLRRELKANKNRNVEDLVNDKEFRTRIRAPITMDDFRQACKNINKATSEKDLEQFTNWTKEFASV